MTSWGTAGEPGAFASILQIWGNPNSCNTSPKSVLGSFAVGLHSQRRNEGSCWDFEEATAACKEEILSVQEWLLLAFGQGEGVTTSVVQQSSSEGSTGPGLAKEGG